MQEYERVVVYIDGFNLYFGLKEKGWQKYYWLNLQKLAQSLLHKGQVLSHTKYFTAKVISPSDKRKRQEAYLSALSTLPDFTIYYGRYAVHPHTCRSCGSSFPQASEKGTDVNIATNILVDAFLDNYDTAILISADSDLVGTIKELHRHFPGKRVKIAFPPGRHSAGLKDNVEICFTIFESKLRKSVFPEKVRLSSGFTVSKPKRWK